MLLYLELFYVGTVFCADTVQNKLLIYIMSYNIVQAIIVQYSL